MKKKHHRKRDTFLISILKSIQKISFSVFIFYKKYILYKMRSKT